MSQSGADLFRLIQALTTAPNRAHKGCGVARPSIEAGTYVDLPTVRSNSNGNGTVQLIADSNGDLLPDLVINLDVNSTAGLNIAL